MNILIFQFHKISDFVFDKKKLRNVFKILWILFKTKNNKTGVSHKKINLI
jgi:hypothetical protein